MTPPRRGRRGLQALWIMLGVAAVLCASCAPRPDTEAVQPTTELRDLEVELPFVIDGPHSVWFHQFNSTAPGKLRIGIEWDGDSRELAATLTGRRRPQLSPPTSPYAEAVGSSPMRLAYEVTKEDLDRGAAWRLVIRAPEASGSAKGVVRIRMRSDTKARDAFEREKIALRSGDLWPTAALQSRFVKDLSAAGKREGLHAIISLKRAVTCEEALALERLGLIRQSFLAGRNSYGFVRRGIDLKHPLIADVLRGITPLESEDKVDPHVLVGDYRRFDVEPPAEPKMNYALNPDGTLALSVLFAKDVSVERIQTILRTEAIRFSPITDAHWTCTLDPTRLTALAGYDEVEWIEAGPVPGLPENDTTRPFINVDAVQGANINVAAGTIAYTGLTGSGVTVGVVDSGIDANHPDLNVVVDRPARGSHGHHVSGIIAASGVQSDQNDANGNPSGGTPFQWRGMAPDADLIDSASLLASADLLTAIQSNSLDHINRSQSVSPDGDYDADNATIDQQIRGGARSGGVTVPRRLQVYSAGNGGAGPQYGAQWGYFAITKQMKNPVIVGNWDAQAGANHLAATSSMGPAYDGRIMPDVVAPGEGVISTGTVGDGVCIPWGTDRRDGYDDCSGTSMAAAATSGVVALLLEAWETEYSTPHGTTIDDTPPLPSTLRAVLIQTADDVIDNNVRNATSNEVDADNNGGNGVQPGNPTATAGPDFATGWGIIDAQAAVDLIEDWRLVGGKRVSNRIIQDAASQGRIVEYDFVVDQVGPLQVTLAWDDVEAGTQNPATSPRLVNDLDLELEDPNGVIVYPWQLGQEIQDLNGNPLADNAQPPGTNIQVATPIQSGTGAGGGDYIPANALAGGGDWAAVRGKDHLNNVEQVFVQNVQANQIGHWTLRVLGFDVRDGAQDYSVVGFPYPDLPDLVVSCGAPVGLSLNTALQFTWTVENTGPVATGPAGSTFDYQIWLSRNFYVDAGDVALTEANYAQQARLTSGQSRQHTSSVTITQANANALLGPGTTLQDLLDADVFLLIQVDSNDVVLEHNETNVAFVQLARLADVALVLDRSDSMSGDVPVSSGTQEKIDILKDSANLFLDLMRLNAGDELAEISFATTVSTDFGPSGLTAITSGNIGQARTAINNLSPGNATNIRDALQRGLNVLTAGAATGHRRVLIFFSDGEKTAGGDPTEATFLQQFDTADVHVYSVGFGTEGGTGYASIDVPLLQALANANADGPGFFHVTESAVSLDKFFVNALAGAIDASVVVDPEGDIRPGHSRTVSALLGTHDAKVSFILTWDNPDAELDLLVRSPAGLSIGQANAALYGSAVSWIEAPAYKVLVTQLPLQVGPNQHQSGRWEMVISNHGNSTVRYAASVIAQSTVRIRTDLVALQVSTATAIPIDAMVTAHGGVPLEGANTAVTANVPLVSLGNLLASAKITQAELAAVPRQLQGETLSERARLYLALQRRVRTTNLIPRVERSPFQLQEFKEPGQYTGVFEDTRVPGIYTFVTRFEGVTPECEPYQRESSWSVYVTPDPNPRGTDVDVHWVDPLDRRAGIAVVFTPRDKLGNFWGPGYADQVVVKADDALTSIGPVVDFLDGSYVQSLEIETPGLTVLKATVHGTSLPVLRLDTGLPAAIAVKPEGAGNARPVSVTITLSRSGDVGKLTGARLVAGGTSAPLTGVKVDADGRIVTGQVPAGLAPGAYAVQVESDAAPGPRTSGVTFRVTGRPGKVPTGAPDLRKRMRGLLRASTSDGVATELGALLREIRSMPEGPGLTPESKRAALDQTIALLAQGRETVGPDEIASVLSAVNNGLIDARFEPTGPVATAAGRSVAVALGSGVSVTFGDVIAAGETELTVVAGPDEIPEKSRGIPHVAYDITTTARFDPTRSVEVGITYAEGDFPDGSLLRVLELDQGRWLERASNLDTEGNTIRVKLQRLAPLVIVER